MLELSLLQAMRLKGRLSEDAAAQCVRAPASEVSQALKALVDRELAVEAASGLRLTLEGRNRLAELAAEERAGLEAAALAESYEEFVAANHRFKQLIRDWQMKDASTPNDHLDEAYDAGVVERLGVLHNDSRPLFELLLKEVPRLTPYLARFDDAVEAVRSGDHRYVARPIADSYHTVWFELHEELIGLLGLSRVEEASAGRAD